MMVSIWLIRTLFAVAYLVSLLIGYYRAVTKFKISKYETGYLPLDARDYYYVVALMTVVAIGLGIFTTFVEGVVIENHKLVRKKK